MWYTNTVFEGSLATVWQLLTEEGFFTMLYTFFQPYLFGSQLAWGMLFGFILFEALLLRFLPGKTVEGPVSPKGNIPLYKANGVAAFALTMATFCLTSFGLHWFSAAILYDNLGSLLGALNLFSLLFCVFLYFKGRFAPSSSDTSTTKNALFDYYWGTELYPQLFKLPVKMFIICRFGMMSWGILLISYCAKQAELTGLSNSMVVSVALQMIYISKFFLWETGYLRSLDMMHDRAGFYICWGGLVWVPCIYTAASMYLVVHPIHLAAGLAAFIFLLGTFCILINYFADKQRFLARETQGNCKIWGKKPITLLARYKTTTGTEKQTILLASGWWGVARHFHYVPEIMAAFLWSVPALFSHFTPYFYVCYLTILLVDRSYRDDKRCAAKYGQVWNTYCELVPYKIIPFVI
jgi:7-dehydrocholesterol reductase